MVTVQEEGVVDYASVVVSGNQNIESSDRLAHQALQFYFHCFLSFSEVSLLLFLHLLYLLHVYYMFLDQDRIHRLSKMPLIVVHNLPKTIINI